MPCTLSGPVLKTSAEEAINKLCRLFQINNRRVFSGSLLHAAQETGAYVAWNRKCKGMTSPRKGVVFRRLGGNLGKLCFWPGSSKLSVLQIAGSIQHVEEVSWMVSVFVYNSCDHDVMSFIMAQETQGYCLPCALYLKLLG